MTVFGAALAVVHGSAQFSVSATYQHGSDAPVSCAVVWRHPDSHFAGAGPGAANVSRVADVLVSDVATIYEGDTLTIAGTAYRIDAANLDRDGLAWSCELSS